MLNKINKTYSFYCDDLNSFKYTLLYDKAIILRDFRNKISLEVCSSPIKFFNMTKFDWINHFRCRLEHCNNQDITNAIIDVFVSYDNKIDTFNKNSKTKIQKDIQIIKYKVNTKNNKNNRISN
jgi:hypothetical protein